MDLTSFVALAAAAHLNTFLHTSAGETTVPGDTLENPRALGGDAFIVARDRAGALVGGWMCGDWILSSEEFLSTAKLKTRLWAI